MYDISSSTLFERELKFCQQIRRKMSNIRLTIIAFKTLRKNSLNYTIETYTYLLSLNSVGVSFII